MHRFGCLSSRGVFLIENAQVEETPFSRITVLSCLLARASVGCAFVHSSCVKLNLIHAHFISIIQKKILNA